MHDSNTAYSYGVKLTFYYYAELPIVGLCI